MPALSNDDRIFWEQNGYVVIHDAVPPENVVAAREAIYAFADMDPADPDSWYSDPPRSSIMVEIYHHQALWDNRQHPRVYHAFSEILDTKKLWVSFDRTSINPPVRHDFPFYGKLHFDIPLTLPIPIHLQGILYLTDCAESQGAFSCVPGFHKKVEQWVQSLPEGADPNDQDLEKLGPVPVPGHAGDLIIWQAALPHWARANTNTRPRVAQYISMSPAQEDNEEARRNRTDTWRNLLSGMDDSPLGWGKGKEHKTGQRAEKLTPLGRKLLGLDRW